MSDIGEKNRDSLNYILVLTNLLSLVIFLSNKNLSTKTKEKFTKKPYETNETLRKNQKESIEAKKRLNSNLDSKNDEIIKNKPTNNEDELKTKQETFNKKKVIKKASEVETNVINFKKAKAAKNQEPNKKQPLKRLVWRFPE